MGWHIDINKNTVRVSRECAIDIFKSDTDIGLTISGDHARYTDDGYTWSDASLEDALERWVDNGELYFDCDHMEHMDYVWQIKDILCPYKVKGDIAFSSADGDNAGTAWCYRFDGEGGCEELSQELADLWS